MAAAPHIHAIIKNTVRKLRAPLAAKQQLLILQEDQQLKKLSALAEPILGSQQTAIRLGVSHIISYTGHPLDMG